MSDSNEKTAYGENKNVTRNLPSWMSSRGNENKVFGKKLVASGEEENSDGKVPKQSKESKLKNENTGISFPPSSVASNFSKLLEGVVFALSGFVNPERSVLRSQALEMGAQYQPDWNPNCTLLVCAFPNTPKFRQVEADCGTIVSKEWISECYSQKRLVDIDSYLLHPGKPWRKQKDSLETSQDIQSPGPKKSQKRVDGGSQRKPTSKTGVSNPASFSPNEVKKWAIDDLDKTISWLDSQEEKPEAREIKNIAAEGILTCLHDAIDSLKDNQGIQPIVEQWNLIPRAVEELAKLERSANGKGRLLKEELCKEAMTWKRIYEAELSGLNEDSAEKGRAGNGVAKKTDIDYDSDETVEMTEEEIDLAFSNIASTLAKD